MTIHPAVYIRPFNANIRCPRTPIAPPFSRTKQTDNRRACCDGDVRRPGVAANVDPRSFRQRIKCLQRKLDRLGLAQLRRSLNRRRQFFLAWSVRHQRAQPMTGPKRVCKFTKPIGAPQFRRPTTARIQNRVVAAGLTSRLTRGIFVRRRNTDWKRKSVRLSGTGTPIAPSTNSNPLRITCVVFGTDTLFERKMLLAGSRNPARE